jgi:hypothetical protein
MGGEDATSTADWEALQVVDLAVRSAGQLPPVLEAAGCFTKMWSMA